MSVKRDILFKSISLNIKILNLQEDLSLVGLLFCFVYNIWPVTFNRLKLVSFSFQFSMQNLLGRLPVV